MNVAVVFVGGNEDDDANLGADREVLVVPFNRLAIKLAALISDSLSIDVASVFGGAGFTLEAPASTVATVVASGMVPFNFGLFFVDESGVVVEGLICGAGLGDDFRRCLELAAAAAKRAAKALPPTSLLKLAKCVGGDGSAAGEAVIVKGAMMLVRVGPFNQ